ncbi:MAG: lipid II:glycine glycyltransferase FemX, partial [Candidatus Hodarchaeota archaeon]
EVFKRTRKYEPIILGAVDGKQDDILSLILSVRIKVIGGIPERFASRSVIFGGILCDDSEKGIKSLTELFKSYDRSFGDMALFTEIRNMTPTNNIKEHLEASGWKFEQYLNYLIDLRKSPDLIFQSFSKSLRRNIRKAQKNDIIVEQIQDKRKLSIFYEMLRQTYSRTKVPLADTTLFESAFDSLDSREMVKFFLARLGNDYIAGRAVLSYKGVLHDWYACASNQYLKFYPNEMLVWEILNWAIKRGLHTFDFGGAGRPNEGYGVRDFKARFNGKQVDYGRYTKVYHPILLNLARIGYQIYRKAT